MRFEYTVITHRRPAGVMHKPEWQGFATASDTDETTVLAQLGSAGWELASVISNPHDTERRYYFKRACVTETELKER